MLAVNSAEFVTDYRIKLQFSDGTKGIIDFRPILEKDNRQVVRQLLDRDLFLKFSIQLDTITWENGVDFAPEFLQEEIKNARHVA